MTRPIGIDLFAGAGGLSLGFEQAGFDNAAAVEIDPIHACVHRYNFPETAVLARSVVGLSGRTIRAQAGIGDHPVDVVYGGAPCQGFSLIGQRALEDPRNSLVKEFVRIVTELGARRFVFENVKGLTVGKHRAFLDELIAAFQSRGYAIRLPWRVLNAADFGAPQDRERLILLGALEGETLPDYPEPVCARAGCARGDGRLPFGPSCSDALDDLPDADGFDELLVSDRVLTDAWGDAGGYARLMRCIDPAGWYYGYKRRWDPHWLTSSARTEHSAISQRRFRETPPGENEPVSRFFKLPPDGLCNTLRAGTDSARGAFTSPRPIHFRYPRCITVREMARLHGYPDWFRFHVTKWHGARQIGNSVPPPLGRAVAAAVLRSLGAKPSKPRPVLPLGELHLLEFDMSAAAASCGVPVVIGRRDRKSGAKKRKQEEIEAALCASAG
ncbi:MAG: DNA cytosine methyltransferase [Opitutaceae bacterium]